MSQLIFWMSPNEKIWQEPLAYFGGVSKGQMSLIDFTIKKTTLQVYKKNYTKTSIKKKIHYFDRT